MYFNKNKLSKTNYEKDFLQAIIFYLFITNACESKGYDSY